MTPRCISAVCLIAVTMFVGWFVGCSSSTSTTSGDRLDDQVVNSQVLDRVLQGEEVAPVPTSPATEPMNGFVLIAPLRSAETYLLDKENQVVHRWESAFPPANSAYLLENGDLLRGARDPDFKDFRGGGTGTMVEKYSWDGELLWTFNYGTKDHCPHHDIAPLPNGNVLMIAWERKSKEEAIAQGRDPALIADDLWPDHVIEVQPDGPTGGKIVWEWHMWDHLVQDFDREKPNFGVIYEHPELIDLNNTGSTPPATPEELRKLRAVGYAGGGDDDDDTNRRGRSDWMHTNAIHYNPQLDQIALSAKNFSEIWIIDHSTTTQEAASHRGGKSGMGGDLLYRWGNPWSYKSGTIDDKKLFDQHDVRWVLSGFPGAGQMTAFNNGSGRDYSSIVEIEPPIDVDGQYILDDEGRFGPDDLAWEYTAENKGDFYSSFISGARRLENGSTFICEGASGRLFEVNSEGAVLWEHVNTFGGELDRGGRRNDYAEEARRIVSGEVQNSNVDYNALFRATKYRPDYPGLAGKSLAPLPDQPIPFATRVENEVRRLKSQSARTEGEDAEQPDSETAQPVDASSPTPAAESTERSTPEESAETGTAEFDLHAVAHAGYRHSQFPSIVRRQTYLD